MNTFRVNPQDFTNFTETDAALLAGRLEEDAYSNPFEGLNDWHLLRSLAFHQPQLAEPYLYLLDIAAYDEP